MRVFLTSQSKLTCPWWQIEHKYSQHTSEDAGHDDVDDVEEWLPLNDQVEGDVFIEIILDVLPAGFVANLPLSIL